MFGNAGRDHMEKYGSTPEHYAWIGWKNHKHSVNNPYAQFQDEYSLEEIKARAMIHEPLTKLQCSPTSDGAAAAIVASERFVDEHELWEQAIEIAGQAMVTDLSSTFDESADCIKIVGYDMTREAARQAYEEAQVGPEDVQVIELHDCFSANELITYEALGPLRGGRGPQAGRGAGDHLRRALGGQPLRRADLQGPPARRHRPRAVLGADAGSCAARPTTRQVDGAKARAAAQHRPRRRRGRDGLPPAGLLIGAPFSVPHPRSAERPFRSVPPAFDFFQLIGYSKDRFESVQLEERAP